MHVPEKRLVKSKAVAGRLLDVTWLQYDITLNRKVTVAQTLRFYSKLPALLDAYLKRNKGKVPPRELANFRELSKYTKEQLLPLLTNLPWNAVSPLVPTKKILDTAEKLYRKELERIIGKTKFTDWHKAYLYAGQTIRNELEKRSDA